MAFQLPEVNVITPDIKNLTIYLRSTHKFGKSTLFRDIILEKYGDPSYGLSVGCGVEKGYKLLDNLNRTMVKTYTDLVDLKSYLINKVYIERYEKNEGGKKKGEIKSKTPIQHNIQIVSFDIVDEIFKIFETEVIRLNNVENPTKKVKSINAADGGRHNGQFRTADLVKQYMDELSEAGFGIFALSHTKMKTIKEKGASTDEDGYNQLTSSLMATYDSVFADVFDLILTGVIDKDYEEKKSVDSEGKEVVKRYKTDEVRKLYFRGTTLIDAGCRFAFGSVPEYIVFDKEDMAADFIRICEEGMEKSKREFKNKNKVLRTTVATTKSEDIVPQEESVDDVVEEISDNDSSVEISPYPDDLVGEVRSLYKKITDKELKAEIRAIVKDYGRFDDVDTETLQYLYDRIKL